jgi:outer membrane protein OmpA-like peptidoglycan-associated protein
MRLAVAWMALLGAAAILGAGGCCPDLRQPVQTIELNQEPAKPTEVVLPPMPPPYVTPRDETPRAAEPPRFVERKPAPVGPNLPAPVVLGLRQLAAQNPGLLVFDEATGRVRLAADLTFDSGSDTVKAEARAVLVKVGDILASDAAKEVKVDIVGHTDTDRVKKESTIKFLKDLRKQPNNMGLSEARAEAVAGILQGARVAASRITTKGVGESQPVADNKAPAGKAKNRRVEVFLSGPQ